jgi:hypothetical protein
VRLYIKGHSAVSPVVELNAKHLGTLPAVERLAAVSNRRDTPVIADVARDRKKQPIASTLRTPYGYQQLSKQLVRETLRRSVAYLTALSRSRVMTAISAIAH